MVREFFFIGLKKFEKHCLRCFLSFCFMCYQDNKTDVKAIMARFNSGPSPGDGPAAPGSRPKVPVHPTLSSGPPINAKKPVLESSLSGSAATSYDDRE